VRKTQYTVKAVARLSIEGEAYLARTDRQELDKLEIEEVLDVVNDARVVLQVGIDRQGKLTDKEPSSFDSKRRPPRLTERKGMAALYHLRHPKK
jgi:hypothetical protein